MKICSILSLGPSFFVSLFWHPPCVCFSVLGIAAISLPGLVEWPNVVGVLWGPVAQLPLSPKLGPPDVPAMCTAYTLLLQLSLDCCWYVTVIDLPPG